MGRYLHEEEAKAEFYGQADHNCWVGTCMIKRQRLNLEARLTLTFGYLLDDEAEAEF